MLDGLVFLSKIRGCAGCRDSSNGMCETYFNRNYHNKEIEPNPNELKRKQPNKKGQRLPY